MTDASMRGIFPILATTFHEDGQLDLASQTKLIHFLLEQGAHGLGLFGIASEGYALTGEERRTLLQLVVRETAGRVPLIVSSGHTGTFAAVELSREAEDMGADALMVLPPHLLKPDGEGLMFYFDAIGRAVKIPVMVQDAPLMTQVAMPAALLARMAREIENVRLAKVEAPPTAPKITDVVKLAGAELTIFGGLNGQFLIEEFQRGAVGTMPGSDMTAVYVRIWSALEGGDTSLAWELFARALPLMRFELQPGMGVSAMKHNLVAAGVIAHPAVRHPTAALKTESLQELAFLREFVNSGITARA